MPRGWELFHGRAFDNLYWHWAGSSSFGGDVPVNPTSGVIPWNNAGTFDDSNLLRRNTSTTDLRYLIDGTVPQLFRIYKTSDNGISTPTNYERIVFGSETANNVFYISTQAGGTGVQRPINIGQISGENAVPVGINASPGSLTAGRALQIGFTQATPTNDVGLYFEGIASQTGDFLQANSPDVGGVVFRILSTGEIAVRAAIRDVNQNSIIGLTATASAVNYVNITNAATGNGPTIAPAGSDSNVQLNISSKANGNIQLTANGASTTEIRYALNSANIFMTVQQSPSSNAQIRFGGGGNVAWTNDSGPGSGTVDSIITRGAVSQSVRISGAAGTEVGALFAGKYVAPSTGTVNVTAIESGTFYTNEGASASVTFNLPTAAARLFYIFYVQDADGLSVVANAGDTIRLAGSVSAAAGNIASTTVGSAVALVAINATEWVAYSIVGTWTVT